MIRFNCIPLLLALTLLSGCATAEVAAPGSSGQATVQGRFLKTPDYTDTLVFTAIDSVPLDPGMFTTLPKMKVKVGTGRRMVNYELIRSRGFFTNVLLGCDGVISFDAREGRTYQLVSRSVDGGVQVWVEDVASSQPVSEVASMSLRVIPVGGSFPIFIPVK